jgi:glutathione S-transferase
MSGEEDMRYMLYGAVRSRAFRVRWMLEELGAEYDFVPAGPRSEEVRAVSPAGKIPVLTVGESVLTDSSAILAYLADRHGQFTATAGTLERARQDAMTFRILDELEGQLWTAAKHSFVLPEDMRVPEVKAACAAEYARNLAQIVAEMPGPFVMGAEMTVPDIILGHCGGWAQAAKFPAPPEAFGDYLARLRARPAFVAAQA